MQDTENGKILIRMNYKIKKISGDASFREFFRLHKGKKTSIIVAAKKERFKNLIVYSAINRFLRKDGTFKGMQSYSQLAYKSASSTYNSFESAKVLDQPDYQVLDMAFGFTVNETDVEFFIRNATDERANLYYNDQDDIPRITTNRPRNMGVRMSYRF